MSHLRADCPRCGTKQITFDVPYGLFIDVNVNRGIFEAFSICRSCNRSTTFLIKEKNLDNAVSAFGRQLNFAADVNINAWFYIERYISIGDISAIQPPDYLSPEIENVFREGATCLAVGCWNAAAVMFRTCVDLATRELIPSNNDPGAPKERSVRLLGQRLTWLFENNQLPPDLKPLSDCIREDGNDGAHEGTLTKDDAENLLDFTTELLKRLYTLPGSLERAEERRARRRGQQPEGE